MTYDAFVDEEIATMWAAHEEFSDVTDDDIEWACTH
jgi:hypothetical protein